MTVFEKWWSSLVRKKAGFGQGDSVKVTMTIGVVKMITKKAHDDGFKCGIKVNPPPQNKDWMKGLFG